MKPLLTRVVLVLLCSWMAVDCATIIHGTTQEIDVSSAPDEAEVWVNGARMGVTPTRLRLDRDDKYILWKKGDLRRIQNSAMPKLELVPFSFPKI